MGHGVCSLSSGCGTGQKLRFCNGLRAFAYRTETALCPRFFEVDPFARYSGVERSSSAREANKFNRGLSQEKAGNFEASS